MLRVINVQFDFRVKFQGTLAGYQRHEASCVSEKEKAALIQHVRTHTHTQTHKLCWLNAAFICICEPQLVALLQFKLVKSGPKHC